MGAQSQTARHLSPGWCCLPVVVALALGIPGSAGAQTGESAASTEAATRETQPTFRMQVERNVVLVRAVVRDAQGQAVSGLRKEDFRLLDNGKPQTITHFGLEVPSARLRAAATAPPSEEDQETPSETALASSTPQRYLALYFDDVHMKYGDLVRARDAADRYLAESLQAGDRVGVFTSSGQQTIDFTDDRGQLHKALQLLRPSPVAMQNRNACPDIFDYQAYLIVHQHDRIAIDIATEEASQCTLDRTIALGHEIAQFQAEAAAARALSDFENEAEYALRGLEQLVRKMATVPGQRSIVLASPGFLMLTREHFLDEIVERALRANVVVNTLDAKGLFTTIPHGEANLAPIVLQSHTDLIGKKAQFQLAREERALDVLRALAQDTGGTFFHNSNDLDEGFRKVGALPEAYYVLGFSPQGLKFDGRFHSLKVLLATRSPLKVQARHGYYAPRKPADASRRAKDEIDQTVFSHDELNELSVEVRTQFSKANGTDVRLSVLARVDPRSLRFRKEEGRNRDDLTIITALFDRHGNYVVGKQRVLELRLLDDELEKLTQSGLNLMTSFEVRPGTYMVRQVVKEADGAKISALSRSVEIPF